MSILSQLDAYSIDVETRTHPPVHTNGALNLYANVMTVLTRSLPWFSSCVLHLKLKYDWPKKSERRPISNQCVWNARKSGQHGTVTSAAMASVQSASGRRTPQGAV